MYADRPLPPGKPHLLRNSDSASDLVSISWSRSESDGGSPISGYLVEHRRVGSPHWVRATPFPVAVPELTLSGLAPGWRYQFRVTAENPVGYSNPSESSDPITVTLQRTLATAPKFTQELKYTTALENDKCEFEVHFLGHPTPKICWFKDDFEIFSSRRIRIVTEPDRSILTIYQTSLSDEGEIKCTATNRAGYNFTHARLTVEAPPIIRLPRQYEEGLLFEIGEVIKLKVLVVGKPLPLVFWYHNGESLQNNDRYEVEYSNNSFSLKISKTQRNDRGEYQIKAVNKLGEDKASFLVTITDKPSPPGKAKVIMTLGRSVTLSWGAPMDDGGCKIGNYIVEYYRMGWNVWLKAATSRQLTTILGDLIEGSEYKFRIKAESPFGVSEPSEESELIFIPDLKKDQFLASLRGRSQPRETISLALAPVPAKRKRSRSQSSSKHEEVNNPVKSLNINEFNKPTRPERTQIITPRQTPEPSPMNQRRKVNGNQSTIEPLPMIQTRNKNTNQSIIDRVSIAQELAYGSPEIKITDYNSSLQDKIYTKAHIVDDSSLHNEQTYKEGNSKNIVNFTERASSPYQKKDFISSPDPKRKLIREHSNPLSGSSEFMLVLYSDEIDNDHLKMFDQNNIPPPLSLSAPEIGVEPPQFNLLKSYSSSSELLHEKAMTRIYSYRAAKAEQELSESKEIRDENRIKFDLKKSDTQINSKDKQGLKHVLGRRASFGPIISTELEISKHSSDIMQQPMFNQNIKSNILELNNFPKTSNFSKMANIENNNNFFANDQQLPKGSKDTITEIESSDSETENFRFQVINHGIKQPTKIFNTEEGTYHPGAALQNLVDKNAQPFEILTKPKSLPDPNYVPKPILKKTLAPSLISPDTSPLSSPIKTQRSLSPRPDINLERKRSHSLATSTLFPFSLDKNKSNSLKPKKRSLSISSEKSMLDFKYSPKLGKKSISLADNSIPSHLPSICAVANISGLTAASIVIPKNLLAKIEDSEEAVVAANHYSDIVETFGNKRKSVSTISPMETVITKRSPSQDALVADNYYSSNAEASGKKTKEENTTEQNKTFQYKGSHVNDFNQQKIPSLVNDQKHDSAAITSKNIAHKPVIKSTKSNSIQTNTLEKNDRYMIQKAKSPTRPSITKNTTQFDWKDNTRINEKFSSTKMSTSTMQQTMQSLSGRTDKLLLTSTNSVKKPYLKEIMTQTSMNFETNLIGPETSTEEKLRLERLEAEAKLKVRGAVDYLTDLAMFSVACWFYILDNELLSIPVLLFMICRHLKKEIFRMIPVWILKRFQKK